MLPAAVTLVNLELPAAGVCMRPTRSPCSDLSRCYEGQASCGQVNLERSAGAEVVDRCEGSAARAKRHDLKGVARIGHKAVDQADVKCAVKRRTARNTEAVELRHPEQSKNPAKRCELGDALATSWTFCN